MNLSFNKSFIGPINDGTKIHTIRMGSITTTKWKEGSNIHFCTGLRTLNHECFKQAPCTGIQEIFMTYDGHRLEISVDGKYLYSSDIDLLIKNDGLTKSEFIEWFFGPETTFSGVLIHWTDFKY